MSGNKFLNQVCFESFEVTQLSISVFKDYNWNTTRTPHFLLVPRYSSIIFKTRIVATKNYRSLMSRLVVLVSKN